MRDYLDSRPIKLRGEKPPWLPTLRPFFIALLFGLIAGLLFLLDQGGFMAPVRGVVEQALLPVAQRSSSMRSNMGDMWSWFGSDEQLREENKQLKQQVSELQAELIAREQVTIENARLRQQLRIEDQHPWRLLGAEVVVRSPDAGRRVITIARGSKDGLHVGMAVVAQTESEPAALVGIVEDVEPYSASVLLITDFASRISARVLYEDTTTLGLVQGQWQHGSRLRLEQFDRGAVLKPGMVVVSAGLSGELNLTLPLAYVPMGIPIGVVDEIVEGDSLSQLAEMRPYVDPDQVRYVWVILSQE